MSRLGRKPVDLPDGVKVAIGDGTIQVEGPNGKLVYRFLSPVKVEIGNDKKNVLVKCESQEKRDKALFGLTRSIIANMVVGVTKGYEKQLEIKGVEYSGKVQGKQLILRIGFSHPVTMDIPEGLTVICPSPNLIVVKGADKQKVGQFAAEIRSKRPVEPYNLKGIKYKEEVVKKKAGKTFVAGAT